MLRKNLALLTVLALAAACLFSACTRKISVAPKTTDLSTVTPTQTHTFTTTVTFSLTPTVTPTVTATFTSTQTPTPIGPIIMTIAGCGVSGYLGDGGPATLALLNRPLDVACDTLGNLYFSEGPNGVIRKVNAAGIISTVAGNGTPGYSGDGGPANSAQISLPWGITFDSLDNLYIMDYGNYRVRKVDTSGTITTIAGNGTMGNSGDGGPATLASFNSYELAFDSSDNLYIADSWNNRIRKVDMASGIIITVVGSGTGAYSGDGGPAISADIYLPIGITFDPSDNLYIADSSNNCIRKVDTGGIITTIAGNGTQGYTGDGGPATSAELDNPIDVVFDALGNLYITDSFNGVIRKVDTSGIITTVVGNGIYGYSGDGGPAISAQVSGQTRGLAFDFVGNLYIADYGNDVVRKVY